MIKPPDWQTLPLYKKVALYGQSLNKSHAQYVNKIDVKPTVLALTHNKIKVAPLVRILASCHDIRQSDINPNHILKAAHGSGWCIDLATHTDVKQIERSLISWNRIYSTTEVQYTFLKPRFFIEEKIHCKYSGKTGKAHDIKVHCINGIPQFLLVRKDQKLRNYYDINWNPIMPLEYEFEKPANFGEILDLCIILSKPFPYVRIDLYMGIDGIYFSEYTFTPHGGKQRLSDEVEYKYGKLWL